MGIIRNSANRVIKGRVGDITYYVSNGQQVARQALNNSNYGASAMRSDAQQVRRVKWANLVNFYKMSKKWMKKAYESKEGKQSDYNKFMQLNVNSARVALTKTEAVQGACIIDAFQITQGSLPTIDVTKVGSQWKSSLSLGSLTIGDSTTIAEFTAALIANNANIVDGMQLSFVSYQQNVDSLGIARCICTFYEVTLDTQSTDLIRDYLPAFCSQTLSGYLGTNDNISLGGFAWIISNQVEGKIFVSSQNLITNNAALLTQYTSNTQLNEAVESYGVTDEVVLSPNSRNAQERVTPPLYLSTFKVGTYTYSSGEYIGAMSNVGGKACQLTLSTATDLTVDSITIVSQSGSNDLTITNATKQGNVISFTAPASSSTSKCVGVNVYLSDGTQISMLFLAEDPDSGNSEF